MPRCTSAAKSSPGWLWSPNAPKTPHTLSTSQAAHALHRCAHPRLESPSIPGVTHEPLTALAFGGRNQSAEPSSFHAAIPSDGGGRKPVLRRLLALRKLFEKQPERLPFHREIRRYQKRAIGRELARVKQFSMLHTDVLILLYHFARESTGNILELGPYVGGSTTAICEGIRDSGRNTGFLTIEKGGQHLGHPSIPSGDILADLRKNLRKNGVDGYVTILEGHVDAPGVVDAVRASFAENGISLLVVDADGMVQRDLPTFFPLCRRGCMLVIDDYRSDLAREKEEPTKRFMDSLVSDGKVEMFGVYGFGTWIGRLSDGEP